MSSKPILVMMTYRGSERLRRCLKSILAAEHHFSRILLSVTAETHSEDHQICLDFKATKLPRAEVICTQRELPTMLHQEFWVDYLSATGVRRDDWVYWLAYDDEVRLRGIDALTSEDGEWPLQVGTAYFGPWAMRHEGATQLHSSVPNETLESWTSFPSVGPTRLPVLRWISDQFSQPTYMQMSGSICSFQSFYDLRHGKPTKRGPMRIEMAVACSMSNQWVAEFSEPVSIIYGRPNSDRASYGNRARREDLHLLAWTFRYATGQPDRLLQFAQLWLRATKSLLLKTVNPSNSRREEWRVRSQVQP